MNYRILAGRCVRQLSKTSLLPRPIPCYARLFSVLPMSVDHKNEIHKLKTSFPNLQSYRFKSKKKSPQSKAPATSNADDDTDSDADEAGEDGEHESSALRGEKESVIKLSQLRTDKIVRMLLGSRTSEAAFIEGNLYKNQMKVLKKAMPVQEGDVIEIEIGPDPKNPDFIKLHRIEILEVKLSTGSHNEVRVLLSKNLTAKPFS